MMIARVGEGIVTSVGSSEAHTDVLANPDDISKMLLYPRQDFSDLHINNEHTSSSYAWCHYCRYRPFVCVLRI